MDTKYFCINILRLRRMTILKTDNQIMYCCKISNQFIVKMANFNLIEKETYFFCTNSLKYM